ncbi:MAG: hypothetical protein NC341_13055 [Blautia sp.]|nr:hypothetical protein [Blautia sp.]MCM1201246.1 hypothetical protein [Bacteroides fragilis]
MQVTDISGVKEPSVRAESRPQVPEKRTGRTETAYGRPETPKEVQEKLRQGAEGATVAISAEGLGLVKRAGEEPGDARREEAERLMYQEMLENTREAAEAQGEGYADLAKALEIARRILNGDIVPAQDEKFLMEYNSEIYMRVKSMAEQKEDPEEYDSLLEEEEEDGSGGGSGKSGSGSIKGVPDRGAAEEVPAGEAAVSDGEQGASGKGPA